MEVKLDKQYPLDVDATRAWALLTDLKAVASCMPGAEITEQLSDTSYKGGVKVKVGPAVAQFGGTVDVIEAVTSERKMVLRGKGADKGGSSASMDLTAIITADPSNPALRAQWPSCCDCERQVCAVWRTHDGAGVGHVAGAVCRELSPNRTHLAHR